MDMKLSNRILIGFFAIIFTYMTAAFLEVRFRGQPNHMDDSNSIVESVDIAKISHLVVMQDIGKQITVIGAEKSRIEVQSLKGDLLQKLKYDIVGDTLTLKRLNLDKDQRVRVYVYMSESNFTGMTVDNAAVIVKELDLNSLAIHQTAGWVRMTDSNNLNNLRIKAIQNANLTFSGSQLDTLSAQIDNSEVKILSAVNRVEGAMYNDSYLQVIQVNDIAFKKDESSRLNLN